jgi:hypothetical protein
MLGVGRTDDHGFEARFLNETVEVGAKANILKAAFRACGMQ